MGGRWLVCGTFQSPCDSDLKSSFSEIKLPWLFPLRLAGRKKKQKSTTGVSADGTDTPLGSTISVADTPVSLQMNNHQSQSMSSIGLERPVRPPVYQQQSQRIVARRRPSRDPPRSMTDSPLYTAEVLPAGTSRYQIPPAPSNPGWYGARSYNPSDYAPGSGSVGASRGNARQTVEITSRDHQQQNSSHRPPHLQDNDKAREDESSSTNSAILPQRSNCSRYGAGGLLVSNFSSSSLTGLSTSSSADRSLPRRQNARSINSNGYSCSSKGNSNNSNNADPNNPTYPDPLMSASNSFQQRVSEMASLESDTVRWERARAMKRKAKAAKQDSA